MGGEDFIFVKWHCVVPDDLGWLHISVLSEKLLLTESWPETLLSLFEAWRDFPFRSAERLANCSFRVVTVSAGIDGNAWNMLFLIWLPLPALDFSSAGEVLRV